MGGGCGGSGGGGGNGPRCEAGIAGIAVDAWLAAGEYRLGRLSQPSADDALGGISAPGPASRRATPPSRLREGARHAAPEGNAWRPVIARDSVGYVRYEMLMFRIRLLIPLATCVLSIGLASCAVLEPGPRQVVPAPAPRASAPPDWFHHEIALARHARVVHQPTQDTAGAQRAYDAIMVPACARVSKSGPDKYRARCKILIARASAHAVTPAATPPCDDHDDSFDTPAQITACND